MTDYVLIRLDNGAHAPVSADYAKAVDAKPLKSSAYDDAGRLKPVKYPATKTAAATETSGTAASDTQ